MTRRKAKKTNKKYKMRRKIKRKRRRRKRKMRRTNKRISKMKKNRRITGKTKRRIRRKIKRKISKKGEIRKRKNTIMRSITMTKATISGAKREMNGTGITKKTKRPLKEETPRFTQAHLTPLLVKKIDK